MIFNAEHKKFLLWKSKVIRNKEKGIQRLMRQKSKPNKTSKTLFYFFKGKLVKL